MADLAPSRSTIRPPRPPWWFGAPERTYERPFRAFRICGWIRLGARGGNTAARHIAAMNCPSETTVAGPDVSTVLGGGGPNVMVASVPIAVNGLSALFFLLPSLPCICA